MKNHLNMIREFSLAFNVSWHDQLTAVSGGTLLLRAQLITEELGELVHALAARDKVEAVDALTDLEYVILGSIGSIGFQDSIHWGQYDHPFPYHVYGWASLTDVEALSCVHSLSTTLNESIRCFEVVARNPSKPHVLRMGGMLERLLFALFEAWSRLGLAQYRKAAFQEVHTSNMSKLGEDGLPILNEAGRVVKGPNYRAPNLALVVEKIDSEVAAHAVA